MMKFSRNKNKEILLHFVLWSGYSLLLFYGPSVMMDTGSALLFSFRTLFINALVFYANIFWLLPRYIGKNNYIRYLMGVLIIMICSGFFYHYTDKWMMEGKNSPFGRSNREWVKALSEDKFIAENIKMLHLPKEPPKKPPFDKGFVFDHQLRMGLLSSLGMLFISTLFWVIVESRQRKQLELALMNQNLVNEMKFLKSQMNPHFLFNALNNIYSLAMLHSIKTPEMILKLSEMLRYVLYESEGKKVPLGREVDYIRNFVEFQRIKIEGIPNLHIDIERVDRTLMIEPMLLIPFVENSFKHSKVEDTEKGWVSMTLTNHGKELQFEISNSVPATKMSPNAHSGIGNENVKRRLNYLYPGKHWITISENDKEFAVFLKIELA